MRRYVLSLLALLLVPASLDADEEVAWVSLRDAVVYASPGVPTGLHPHLPGGRPPKRLEATLPDGPILVLGLPGSDPAALHLARALDLLPFDEDLRGGYVACAWQDGERPIGVIFGGDAAALYAAKAELTTTCKAGVGMRVGVRRMRPQYRVRTFANWVRDPSDLQDAIDGHANRVWILEDRDIDHVRLEILPVLRRYGIVPVLVLSTPPGAKPGAEVEAWRREIGIRHFAILGNDRTHVRAYIETLHHEGPVDEIVVVAAHDLLSDVLPGERRLPLSGFGDLGVRCAWAGPSHQPVSVTREDALRAVKEAGTPVHLWETWCKVRGTWVPSIARGRDPDLGEVLEGVLVLPGPGAAAVLADAWIPSSSRRDAWEDVMLPLLPTGLLGPREFLKRSARRIEDRAGKPDCPKWLTLRAGSIRGELRHLLEQVVLVPRVPSPIVPDGRLDEPAWTYAVSWQAPPAVEGKDRVLDVLAVADGRRLALAIRAPSGLDPFEVQVGSTWDTTYRSFRFARAGPSGLWTVDDGRGDVHTCRGCQGGGLTWEVVLDHYDLDGDAHPTRVFVIATNTGEEQKTSIVLGR